MRNKLLILIIFAALFSPAALRAQTVVLKADSVIVPCQSPDTFLIPVRLFQFTEVAGLQFTLSWNPAHLDYIHITGINPAFAAGIGLDTMMFINTGKFTLSWTDPGGLTLPDSTILLSVAFTRIGGPATLVEFSNTPTDIVAINTQGDDLTVQTAPGLVNPVDNIPPTVTCPGNVSLQVTGPTAVDSIAPGSVLDNCSTPATGWSASGATMASFPNDPDASGAVFNIGQSTVNYLVTDVGGNTASCSFLINLELLPNDSLTILASNETTSCGQTVTVDITALNFDSLGGLQFSLGWNPAVLQFDTFTNFNPALDLTINNFGNAQTGTGFLGFAWTTNNLLAGTTLADGTVLFSLTFTIVGGSSGSSTIQFGGFPTDLSAFTNTTVPASEIGFITVNGSVVIADTQAPVIACPANVTVQATGGITAQVNGLEPTTLTDNCGGNISLTYQQTGSTPGQGQGPANGVFNAGSTTVVYTAADAAGNTATCSFTVTVDAGTPLTLELDTILVDCQGGSASICVDLTVQDFVDIIGVQFNVVWDSAVLKFDSVVNHYPGLNLTNSMFFNFSTTSSGTLRFFGGNSNGWPDIPNDSVFFTICYTVLANSTSNLDFSGTIDAANSSFNNVPVETISGYFGSTDLTPPAVLCPPDAFADAVASECSANVALDPAQATDACSGIKSITPDKLDDVYASGVTVVTFTAEDNSGNTATCSVTVTVQDNLVPEISNCPANITVDVQSANCTAVVNWQPPLAFDNCVPNSPPLLTTTTAPGSAFPIGDSTVVYKAVDIFNDSSFCSFTVTVRDTVFPVLICPGNVQVSTSDTSCTATVSWQTPIASDNCDNDLMVQGDHQPDSAYAVGQTVVTYFATDNFGNQVSCSFTITVTDMNPPVLDSCPPNITVTTLPDTCGATATWAPPIATDDCTADVSLTPTFPPGSFFPVGTTLVEYTAADAGGNAASCFFSVTVTENVPPVLFNCPVGFVFVMPPDKCDTVVTWLPPTATDNCALDTLITTNTPGSVFSTGTHTVTYTAIDDSGNSATCVFVVDVQDNVPPVFAANSICDSVLVVDPASACGEVVDWTLPVATDNCLLDTIIATKLPTDTIYDQITTVVIRAYDASGNSDTCTFTIQLNVLIIPPSFNTPLVDVMLSGCPQPVSWTAPTDVLNACGPVIITQFPDSIMTGDTFPVGITNIIYVANDSVSGAEVYRDTLSITIIEDIAPVINCPSAGVVVHIGGVVLSDPAEFVNTIEAHTECDSVNVSFSLPLATDNCGDALVVQTSGPFSGFSFLADSVYTLMFQASDAVGNTSLCSVTVAVVGLQPLNPQVDPQIACPGDEVVLTVDNIPGASYTWAGPNQAYPDNSQITVIASPANAGVYTVFATINSCITPLDSVQVVLASDPDAVDDIDYLVDPGGTLDSFNVLTNDMFSPPDDFTVTFDSLPQGLTYLGNGLFSFESYDGFAGLTFFYELCSNSCQDFCDMATVIIRPRITDCSFIPNIITPNGDEVNDYFLIPCLDSGLFRDNTLVIYNQWGDKVFEAEGYSNDPLKAWKGTLNGESGKDLPDGVYFYVFKAGPDKPTQKGFVEIYR